MTPNQAQLTAKRIRNFWARRGAEVEVRIVREDDTVSFSLVPLKDNLTVRSNMKNGMPQGGFKGQACLR